ncbi:MAG TPA: serine/threonine-protein phosphatase [Rhodanobacteraceae bacterium]|nr:serine/threonine-protein phosphatase [Rhodanobacteraceae bacterium]
MADFSARLRVAFAMHRGAPARQQDAVLVGAEVWQEDRLLPREALVETDVLAALADGVATSPNAQFTSRFVLKTLPRVIAAHPEWLQEGQVAARHVRETQARLAAELARRPNLRGSSCTLVAAHFLEGRVVVLNSGDSRAYLRRRDGSVQQLSRDHTELQRMIDAGEADASTEYASIYDALSDCLIADPHEGAFAIHRAEAELRDGDAVILCTDGIHDVLGDATWCKLMGAFVDPLPLVQATHKAVLKAGAPDNFTLIAVGAAFR